MTAWLVFARSCNECGPRSAFSLHSAQPTEKSNPHPKETQTKAERILVDLLGGMNCISTGIVELELDGDPVRQEGE